MGELVPFGRSRRRRRRALPPQWARHVRRRGFSAGQLRLTLWSGLLLGLLLFQAMRFWPAPLGPDDRPGVDEAPPAFVDPYAESRKSRERLREQERAPPPFLPRIGSGPVPADGGDVRVIDGDTFVHAGDRIRIADIDTPEVNGRCPEETALAARATARTRQLLAQGPFELHPLPSGRDEDRYGRKLRIVTRGGRSIGDVLVEEGLARTWTGRREGWCS